MILVCIILSMSNGNDAGQTRDDKMGEYFFSATTSQKRIMTDKAAKTRDQIAEKIGGKRAGYSQYYDSARKEWKCYGFCANKGFPFNEKTAKEIQDAWKLAGV